MSEKRRIELARYGCKYRRPSSANVPVGWVLLETGTLDYDMQSRRPDLPVGRSQYGTIGYDRPLTEEEMDRCQLERVYPQCTSHHLSTQCELDEGHAGMHRWFDRAWNDNVGRYAAARPVHSDSRLIAAAPGMLAALHAARSWILDVYLDGDMAVLDSISEAIDKAEGRSDA